MCIYLSIIMWWVSFRWLWIVKPPNMGEFKSPMILRFEWVMRWIRWSPPQNHSRCCKFNHDVMSWTTSEFFSSSSFSVNNLTMTPLDESEITRYKRYLGWHDVFFGMNEWWNRSGGPHTEFPVNCILGNLLTVTVSQVNLRSDELDEKQKEKRQKKHMWSPLCCYRTCTRPTLAKP